MKSPYQVITYIVKTNGNYRSIVLLFLGYTAYSPSFSRINNKL